MVGPEPRKRLAEIPKRARQLRIEASKAEAEARRAAQELGLIGPDDPFDTSEYDAAREQVQREAERATARLLSPTQVRRLEQIALQSRGLFALIVDPDIIRRLGLAPYQQAQIGRILARRDDAHGRLRQARVDALAKARAAGDRATTLSPFDPAVVAQRERSGDIDVAAIEAIEAVLTDRQRRRYRSLVGEPFDFSATTKWPPPAPPARPDDPDDRSPPKPEPDPDDPAPKTDSKPPM